METFGHEIEHSFDQIVKDGKAEFREDLSAKVKKIVGASVFEKARAQYKADYEKLRARDGSVAELSYAELEAEATANVVGKYLSNMTLLKKLAATDYSLGRGLLAAIRRMKDKWTSAKAFAKENDSTAFAEYRKMTRIENLLMKELNAKMQMEAKKEGVSFSPSESFASQIDRLRNGTFDSTNSHIMVDDHTPSIFLEAGLSDKPILIPANKAKTAMGMYVPNKRLHSVSAETLKKLPELLKSPVMMMESTEAGSAIAFVEAKDNNGSPVLVAIQIDGHGNFNNVDISSNVVKSVYGKDTNPIGYIEKAVTENRIVYWDKKRSQALFETPGLELPDNLKRLDSDVIIHKFGEKVNPSGDNISYSPAPVTPETDSRYLSLARDPQKNESELRRLVKEAAEKAGYNSPLLYHGTGAFGFTTFDLSKMDDRRTIFLTDSEEIASTYSGSKGIRGVSGKANIPDNVDAVYIATELNNNLPAQEQDNGYYTLRV